MCISLSREEDNDDSLIGAHYDPALCGRPGPWQLSSLHGGGQKAPVRQGMAIDSELLGFSKLGVKGLKCLGGTHHSHGKSLDFLQTEIYMTKVTLAC